MCRCVVHHSSQVEQLTGQRATCKSRFSPVNHMPAKESNLTPQAWRPVSLPAGPPHRPMGRWFMRHRDTCSFPGSVTTSPGGVTAHSRWLKEKLMTDLVTELQEASCCHSTKPGFPPKATHPPQSLSGESSPLKGHWARSPERTVQ